MVVGSWLAVAALGQAVTLPSASRVYARLDQSISSQSTAVGAPVTATLVGAIELANGRIVPPGSTLTGTVTVAQPHSVARQARLAFTFSSVRVGDARCGLPSRILDVENARETVDKAGVIDGPRNQADSVRGRIELLSLAVLVPEWWGLDVAQTRLREGVRVDITYPKGVDLVLQTTEAVSVSDDCTTVPPPSAVVDPKLAALLAGAPTRTTVDKRPADLINVALIGSRERVEAAFADAGWMPADALSLRSDTKSVLAILSREGYSHAPVSVQYFDGRLPDLVFQKQTNTFAKRHHVRLWRWNRATGQEIWLAASTHDVGVKFDVAQRSFTHRVETRVDLERDKIVRDLGFAGATATLLDRPGAPRSMVNATADAMETDGKLAVLWWR